MSSEQFRRDLAKIKPHIAGRTDTFVRAVALAIGTALIQRSPVDTGLFRGNWNTGIGAPDSSTNETDTTGASSIARLNARLAAWSMGKTIYITNHLPYARRLEYGWSQQAPQGMVRITVTEFQNYCRDAVGAMR